MENGQIEDDQIRASSEVDNGHAAVNGRLNLIRGVGAWLAKGGDENPWLQVDFLENTTVTAISTQGRHDSLQFVKSYTVSYSNDGTSFKFCEESGEVKVAAGTRFT